VARENREKTVVDQERIERLWVQSAKIRPVNCGQIVEVEWLL